MGPIDLDDDNEERMDQTLFAEINMTPFIDVVLVLLMMLMFSTQAFVKSVQQGEFDIELPESKSTAVAAKQHKPIRIQLSQRHEMKINETIVAKDDIMNQLQALYDQFPYDTVMLEADGSIAHRDVVHLMDLLQSVGFRKIGIRTDHES